MLPYQLRVIDEKKDLDLKIENLMEFFETETYEGLSEEERSRMRSQRDVMKKYSDILRLRIANFK